MLSYFPTLCIPWMCGSLWTALQYMIFELCRTLVRSAVKGSNQSRWLKRQQTVSEQFISIISVLYFVFMHCNNVTEVWWFMWLGWSGDFLFLLSYKTIALSEWVLKNGVTHVAHSLSDCLAEGPPEKRTIIGDWGTVQQLESKRSSE